MPRAIVFTSRLLAEAVRDRMNTRAGVPIAGVNVGGGRHVTPPLGTTTRVSAVHKHPTLARWAVLVTKPRPLLWWRAVKQAAQDRINANNAQPGDVEIVATVDADVNGTFSQWSEVS